MTEVPNTLAERVAGLTHQDRFAAMAHGPELLCALRLTQGILLAVEADGEFSLKDCEISITVREEDGSSRTIVSLDGAQAWADNEAVLAKIKEDPDNG